MATAWLQISETAGTFAYPNKSLAIVDSKFVLCKPEPGPIVFALIDINTLAPERISRRSVQPCGE